MNWAILAQLVITLALLAFAGVVADSTTRSVIVNSTISYWLVQGARKGSDVVVKTKQRVQDALAADSTESDGPPHPESGA